MGIADIVVPTETVEYRGVTFQVRGMSFADLGVLVAKYPAEIEKIRDDFQNMGESAGTMAEMEFIGMLLQDCTDVVAMAIAVCAVESVEPETIKAWPPALQITTVQQIFNLTVQEAGGLKKLVSGVMDLAENMTNQLALVNHQITGISTSAVQ